jgi:hypothetical protein
MSLNKFNVSRREIKKLQFNDEKESSHNDSNNRLRANSDGGVLSISSNNDDNISDLPMTEQEINKEYGNMLTGLHSIHKYIDTMDSVSIVIHY